MEQEIPDYDMDSEDETWLNKQPKKMEVTAIKFENMMDRLEKGSGQTVSLIYGQIKLGSNSIIWGEKVSLMHKSVWSPHEQPRWFWHPTQGIMTMVFRQRSSSDI